MKNETRRLLIGPSHCEGPCDFFDCPPTNQDLRRFPDQACRVIKDLTLLLEISQALNRSLDLRETVQPVLARLATHLGMGRSFITIFDRDREELRIDQAFGLDDSVLDSIRYRPGEGIIGRVVHTGKPKSVRDIHRCPDFQNQTKALEKIQAPPGATVAFISVPVFVAQGVVGTINAFRTIDRMAPESSLDPDVRLLTLIAAQIGHAVQTRQQAQEQMYDLREENERLRGQISGAKRPEKMIGGSAAMQRVFLEIQQASPGPTTVLLRGESGVGKELVAEAIHAASPRAKKPFIAVNCAALPENLIESELFGHERGAFTGAMKQRKGRFELSDGGTIFLDEVGELPLGAQAKFLRVLQESTLERVGGDTSIRIDTRVIAATNRPLEEMLGDGSFRQDLYYRLNVFPIFIPPLRERKSDILALADHFAEKYAMRLGKPISRISTPAIDMLMSYHWPGNVRELENVIERAVLVSHDAVIHGYHLPASLQTGAATATVPSGTLEAALDSFEREMLVEALKNSSGNMAAAARQLGITERQMGLRVRKHAIHPESFRSA